MESRLKDEGIFLLSIGVAASDLTEEKGRKQLFLLRLREFLLFGFGK